MKARRVFSVAAIALSLCLLAGLCGCSGEAGTPADKNQNPASVSTERRPIRPEDPLRSNQWGAAHALAGFL